ncbi:hypothetical protein CC86DRAFT_366750 [Ophiobolus disseminans]|uniref:Uncharacterized protein n=1 Tax=Ophiobolus disseminans TaxID=1469910 RepID=A0A6A7ADI5_9PLEO|nr:hypothetical protein CC86DRAFT_366750 [Ophiobolus disseminans]
MRKNRLHSRPQSSFKRVFGSCILWLLQSSLGSFDLLRWGRSEVGGRKLRRPCAMESTKELVFGDTPPSSQRATMQYALSYNMSLPTIVSLLKLVNSFIVQRGYIGFL